jgi:hypothetical protein
MRVTFFRSSGVAMTVASRNSNLFFLSGLWHKHCFIVFNKLWRLFMANPNEHLRHLIRLTREMMALADEGDRDRIDDSCGIIYGILRDAAYRLRKVAAEECEKHFESGLGENEE